jgi:hypothetical protein
MRITDPVLVPDVSIWCDHIVPQEFEDGGCASVVVGLYPVTVNGKKVLSPVSRQQCIDVATKSKMVLQGYFWDDIILDPLSQANWLADTLVIEGLPIKFVWADQEQWWGNWDQWYQFLARKLAFGSMFRPSAANINSHNLAFISQLSHCFPESGVYTNRGFVDSWAPSMNAWLPLYKAWVAQYGAQPKVATKMTWAQLKANWLPAYDLTLTEGQIPAQVVGHQFTGDMCMLPGSYNQYAGKIPFYDGRLPLDVSVFSKEFIDGLRGGAPAPMPGPAVPPVIPGPTPTAQPTTGIYLVRSTSWIFETANDGAGCKLMGRTALQESVTVGAITGEWAKLTAPVEGWVRMKNLTKAY